ncbi:MAG: exo-beta-1,3-glucanase, partial [Alphaproteobacteria bacterium]|nr:exo-beta-1,3-glucanase [Alphaproteobacteria bacterium]
MRTTPLVLVLFLAVAIGACAAALAWVNRPQDAGPGLSEPLPSASFAPYREGQSPLTKVYPSAAQIEEDLARLQGLVRGVRTYTAREGMDVVPALAGQYGLTVTHGAWIGGEDDQNRAEIEALIAAANRHPDTIRRVIVGNEVLLRNDLSAAKLIALIREVKARVAQPVSYADVWAFFLKNPEVAAEVDILTIHILPFWEDEPVSVENAAEHIVKIYRLIADAFPGKPILIGESGWPTLGRQRGPAAPGVVNAARFQRSLVQVARDNGFDFNFVEAFDQPWKSAQEGTMGASWGMISSAREVRYPPEGPVVEDPHWPVELALSAMLAAGLLA